MVSLSFVPLTLAALPRRLSTGCLSSLLAFSLCSASTVGAAHAAGNSPAAASAVVATPLDDQFGKAHVLPQEFKSRPLVIVAGDQRETRDSVRAWINALREKLAGKATLLGLAELDDVPFFVPNSSITDKMRKLFPNQPVLCDWDNEVYEAIGFEDSTLIAVGVYNRKGKRTLYVKGKPTAAQVAKILSAASPS